MTTSLLTRGLKVPALTALPFGEDECDGDATNALQARQPPVVVVHPADVESTARRY
jgi:hypothetical protein